MIRFLVSEKGLGKTKQLIQMANETAQTADGNLVFIEKVRRNTHDVHYSIRLVETEQYSLANYREFVGFLCGILSQNSDIQEIFVDGLNKIIQTIDNEQLTKLLPKLEKLSADHEVDFVISFNYDPQQLPETIKPLLLQ